MFILDFRLNDFIKAFFIMSDTELCCRHSGTASRVEDCTGKPFLVSSCSPRALVWTNLWAPLASESDHEDLHPCWRFRGQEGDFFSGEYVCIWAVSPVQSLGMLAHTFKDEMAMLAESVQIKEGSVERGWERDRRRNTTKVQLAFCSEIIPLLTDFPLW